ASRRRHVRPDRAAARGRPRHPAGGAERGAVAGHCRPRLCARTWGVRAGRPGRRADGDATPAADVSGTMTMTSLRTLFAKPPIVVAPGCYDALTALMIERAGFAAAYFSGASLAYTRFGRPDIGLISMSEVADAVAAIRERMALPLIVDADTGFGNALNVMRTVKTMARAGASALQLEDQTSPKRCGHL